MRNLLFLFIMQFLFLGCVEEFDLIQQKVEPRLVVEGLITNKKGPYYIRLTKSNTGRFIKPDYSYTDSSTAVRNALIIITDNENQIDTVRPINIKISDYSYNNQYGYYYKLLFDNYGNVTDTIILQDPIEFREDRGYYKTNQLLGVPGRTYYIKIICENKQYQASAYMPSVPPIDSIGYIKKVSEKDGQEYYIPLIYFSEPQDTDNYYLVQLNDEESVRQQKAKYFWQFSVISDEFLQPYVNGLNISLGATPRSIQLPFYSAGDSIYVGLSSLTYDAYQFYNALLQQFKNDGGAYQASPSSPATNIDNGGLGFFRASSISEKKIKIPFLIDE